MRVLTVILIIFYISGCGNDGAFNPYKESYFKYAWHLNSKQHNNFFDEYNINPNADINITAAWEHTQGEGVTVAVIDIDFEVDHEDIQANVVHTYNIHNNDYNVTSAIFEESHGLSCAALIAATANRKGIIGVAPKSKLILIQQYIMDDAHTIKAFEYAKQQGAQVISCSWGTERVSEAVTDKINELYQEGITILFSFGNTGESFDESYIHDEAELDSVIGVGASSEHNDVATYSSYGIHLDILAPAGENIGIPTADATGAYGYHDQFGYINNNYTFFRGVSASTAVASGVVALMISINPELSPKDIKQILTETADKIGTDTYKNGFHIKYGYGKINAGKAVSKALAFKTRL